MTESEVIDAAREAGFEIGLTHISWESYICTEELQRFAAIIAAKQRSKDAEIAARYATGAANAIRGQE